MNNNYLSYTSKDYNSIYEDLVNAIPSLTNLWTNTEDGDPGIVLVKLMSALGDMLSYNMDKQALEYYSSTVTQRKNANKLFNLIGYKMHWYRSATCMLTLTNNVPVRTDCKEFRNKDTGKLATPDEVINNKSDYQKEGETDKKFNTRFEKYKTWYNNNTINFHRYIDDDNRTLMLYRNNSNNLYYTLEPITTYPGVDRRGHINYTDTPLPPESCIQFKAIQGTLCSTTFNESNIINNRYYINDIMIDENYIWIKKCANGESDEELFIPKEPNNNLLLNTDGELYFEFGVDEFDMPYIELSRFWKDKLKTASDFVIYYIRTDGAFGNITNNYLNRLESVTQYLKIEHCATTQTTYGTVLNGNTPIITSTPGYNPESAHEAYINSLNYVTTYDTLVTLYDFERFVKRYGEITNALAVDKQHMNDLNNTLLKKYDGMSLNQMRDTLSNLANSSTLSKDECIEILSGRQMVVYDETNSSAEFPVYSLNLHTVYGYFQTEDINGYKVADYVKPQIKSYYKYTLSQNPDITKESTVIIGDNAEVEDDKKASTVCEYLDNEMKALKIVNVKVNYGTVRVFPWRCCGTIYLKAPVSKSEGNEIIGNIINKLSYDFAPQRLTFGKRLTYMEVIDSIMSADNRINYFDAGMGNRKLIYFDESVDESYFNPISLMRYVQTKKENNENVNESENYYQLLTIDSEYILE